MSNALLRAGSVVLIAVAVLFHLLLQPYSLGNAWTSTAIISLLIAGLAGLFFAQVRRGR